MPASVGPAITPRAADGKIQAGPTPDHGREIRVLEYDRVPLVGSADGGGVCELTVRAPSDRLLLVDRIVTVALATPAVFVYVGDVDDANLADLDDAGKMRSVLARDVPIFVPAGGVLRIRWIAATPATRCTANVQLRRGLVG